MGRWSTSPTHSTVHEGQISAGGLKWCKWLNLQQKLQLTQTLCFTIPEASFSIPNRCLARLTVRINRATDAPECSPPGVVALEHGAQSRTCFWWAEPHLGHRTHPAPLSRHGPSAMWCVAALLFPTPLKHPGEPGWRSVVWCVPPAHTRTLAALDSLKGETSPSLSSFLGLFCTATLSKYSCKADTEWG